MLKALSTKLPPQETAHNIRVDSGFDNSANARTVTLHNIYQTGGIYSVGIVNAGNGGTGYLLCPNIEVNDSATLNAGGIVVSGFYDAKTAPSNELHKEENFRSTMAANQNILDGKANAGLVVNGGKVDAEYITGDVNGKITVNGGVVTANQIGSTGKLYGYTRYVPMKGEKSISIPMIEFLPKIA